MRLRAALAALLCLSALACSEGFKNDDDELEYLSSLSQPSVRQFHRRKELEAKRTRQLETQAAAAAKEQAEKEKGAAILWESINRSAEENRKAEK